RSSTFRHTPPYHPYTLSLHDALPIYPAAGRIAVNRCEDQLEKAPSLEVEKISKRDSYSAISAPCPPAKTGLYLPMTQPCHVWSRKLEKSLDSRPCLHPDRNRHVFIITRNSETRRRLCKYKKYRYVSK